MKKITAQYEEYEVSMEVSDETTIDSVKRALVIKLADLIAEQIQDVIVYQEEYVQDTA